MANYIVQRQSLDWSSPSYSDQNAAENFAYATVPNQDPARVKRSVDLTLSLIDFWNSTFDISFSNCRSKVKEIAHQSWQSVEDCDGIYYDYCDTDFHSKFLGNPECALFTDDDDWYAPDIFWKLRGIENANAWVWRRTRFDGEFLLTEIGDPLIAFTNNYAFRGSLFSKDSKIEDIIQHGFANRNFVSNEFDYVAMSNSFLSMTNKIPCSHNMLRHTLAKENPVEFLIESVEKYTREIKDIPTELNWSKPYVDMAQSFFKEVLESRK